MPICGVALKVSGQRAAAIADFDTVIQLKIRRRLPQSGNYEDNLGQDVAIVNDFTTLLFGLNPD